MLAPVILAISKVSATMSSTEPSRNSSFSETFSLWMKAIDKQDHRPCTNRILDMGFHKIEDCPLKTRSDAPKKIPS